MRKNTIAVLGLAFFLLAGQAAYATSMGGTVGRFEIDGDSAENAASEPIDWVSLSEPVLKPWSDAKKSNKDDIFRSAKQNEPGGWVCGNGLPPQKDDLISGAIAFRELPTGTGGAKEKYIYARWLRLSTNGTADVDYEFNQSDAEFCPGVPLRTNGDILLAFDFDGGGSKISIRAFRWKFTGPGIGVFEEDSSKLVEHTTYDATVSGVTLADPGVATGAFGELSLNLTRTIGDICPNFTSAWMKTRSSVAITSALKDRTQRRNDLCPPPTMGLTKRARSSTVGLGGNVTFDIDYSNSGPGTAGSAVVKDVLPAGTSYVGCTGGCTHSSGTVTWNIAGPIPPGGGGTVSLTIRVDQLPAKCQLCNTATVDSPQQPGTPDASSQACVTVGPPAPDATNAAANGTASGIHITDTGLGIDELYPKPAAVSTKTGPGDPDRDSSYVADVTLPAPPLPPSILNARVVGGTATSTVTTAPYMAEQNSIAEVAGLNILDGVLTAEVVRAVALAQAGPFGSSYNTNGTGFVNLLIDTDGKTGPGQPVLYDNAAPGTEIDLSQLFGRDGKDKSFVTLRSVAGETTGNFVADTSVTMIYLHAVDRDPLVPGKQTTDITISRAVGHAQFPSGPLCPNQGVAGHAFIASANTTPEILPVVVGYASVPVYGGNDGSNLDVLKVPADGSTLFAGAWETQSTGSIGSEAVASSEADTVDVCVLHTGTTCTVQAGVVKSRARSVGNGSGASSSDAGTELLNLYVAGSPPVTFGVTPAPNTVIPIAGLGFVVLNEQLCDGAPPQPPFPEPGPVTPCGGATHSGLTVRAIRLVVTSPLNVLGLQPGVQVIVAEAYSGATFG